MKKQNNLNAQNLGNALWDTLLALKSKKIKPAEANAIASQSREICNVVKTQLEYYKACNVRPKETDMLLKLT